MKSRVKVKAHVRWILLFLLMSLFSISTASSSDKNQALAQWLFVIKAGHAKLVYTGDNQFKLTVESKSVEPVLAFTDRPIRIAVRLKPKVYIKLVQSGSNSFNTDAPNIVLNWGGKGNLYPYEIVSRREIQSTVVYTLRLLGHVRLTQAVTQTREGGVALYIDTNALRLDHCYEKKSRMTGSQLVACINSSQD